MRIHKNRIFLSLLILILSLNSTLALADSSQARKPVVAYEVTEYSLSVGKSQTIVPKVQNYSGRVVYNYYSENETIATVNANGKATGVAPGTVTIHCDATAGDYEFKLSYVLNVVKPITKIKTTENRLYMYSGLRYKPDITIEPSDATNQRIEWTSSNSRVASVDDEGYIKANSVGKCTITGTATDGSKAKVSINVEIPQVLFSENDIVVDSPEGYRFKYWRSLESGSFFTTTGTTGNCFTVSEVRHERDMFAIGNDNEHEMIIIPRAKGNGKFYVEINGHQYYIKIAITRDAVYEKTKFSSFGKDKALLGKRFIIEGTLISCEEEEEFFKSIINVEDKPGQFAIILEPKSQEQFQSAYAIGESVQIRGVFDRMDEYIADTGLYYDVPVIIAE